MFSDESVWFAARIDAERVLESSPDEVRVFENSPGDALRAFGSTTGDAVCALGCPLGDGLRALGRSSGDVAARRSLPLV